MNAAESFDVMMKFILDQAEAQKSDQYVKTLSKDIEDLGGAFPGDELGADFANFTKEVKKVDVEIKKVAKTSQDTSKIIVRDAKLAASELTRVSSVLSGISNTFVIGGTAVSGGLVKIAKDFISSTKENTDLTREWNAETESIAQSYAKVGAVAAREILPFLKEAADIAANIAAFAEQNPDLVGGALKIGVISLAIGVIGKAVSSGIKLVADATFIAATTAQLLASGQNLAASAGMELASGTFAVTVGAVLLPALVIFAGIMSGVLVGLLAYQQLAKSSGGALPSLETLGVESFVVLKTKFQEIWDNITGGANRAAQATEKFGENTKKLVEDFQKMNDDLLAEDEKFAASKQKINEDANNAILKANISSAAKIVSINENAARERDSIIANFNKESASDLAKYESQRANIIRDGGIEIARIEADRLEKLRKLEQDHSERVDDLAANRDALGLVLEQRKFDKDKAEIDRNTNQEIAQRRQDLAIRLNDLAQSFAAERVQKQAQYIQDLKDNEAARIEKIKEERKANEDQLRQIRADAAARLRELIISHNEERQRIRENFIAEIRDLDASLLGERQKKIENYNAMLADLDKFLSSYRLKASGRIGGVGAGIPGFAAGGYTPDGIIRSHAGEFVSNASTTRALERLVGGRLSQQGLLGAVVGSSESIQWNDSRRFSGEYTKAMKRENRQNTLDTLSQVFKKRRR